MENLDYWVLIANVLIVICFVVNVFTSYKKGLILSFWDCFGTILALFFAWYFSTYFSSLIRIYPMNLTPMGDTNYGLIVNRIFNNYAWLIVLFIVIKIAMTLLRPFIKTIQNIPLVKEVNQLLGSVFGVVLTWIWCLIAVFVLSMPIIEEGSYVIDHSLLNFMNEYSFDAIGFASEFINENEFISSVLQKDELSFEDTARLEAMMEEYNISSDWTQ